MTGNVLPLQTLYSTNILVRYQASRRITGVMPEKNTYGSSQQLQWLAGETQMQQAEFDTADIPITNFGVTQILTSPLNFQLKMAISESQMSLINLDFVNLMSNVQGLAAGRAVDVVIANAIFNNPLYSSIKIIDETVGPNTGLNVDKLVAAATELNNDAVDDMFRVGVGNSDCYASLMLDPLYNDSRISNMYPLMKGPSFIREYVNMEFRQLAKNSPSAFPITETTHGSPAVPAFRSYVAIIQYAAMTLNFNRNIATKLVVEPANERHNVLTTMTLNSNIYQPKGIVLIEVLLDANGKPFTNETV